MRLGALSAARLLSRLRSRHSGSPHRLRRARSAGSAAHDADLRSEEAHADEAAALARRHALSQTLHVCALEVSPRLTHEALRALRPLLLSLPGVPAVLTPPGAGERRLVLLSPVLVPPPPSPALLPPPLAAFLARAAAGAPAGEPPPRLLAHSQSRPYAQLSAAEALHALLPASVPPPASWEEVGHVLHLNLRAEQLPWARLIGAVLLDKGAPRCATVLSKRGQLRGPHRTFEAQLLAGEPRFCVRVAEGGLSFRFDLRCVYWNSRLGGERARLASLFGPADAVWDLSCGVGPLALAAAARGADVTAFDLNPAAAAAAAANAAANGLAARVQVRAGDSGALARALLRAGAPPPSHVVVNLPEQSPELLGAALARAFPAAWAAPLPVCHVYAFSRAERPREELLARLAAALRCAEGS